MWKAIGREGEDPCVQLFRRYLEKRLDAENVVLEKVAMGEDPPDYFMLVQNRRYAVEITTLIASIPLKASTSRPLPEIHEIHTRLIKKIEKSAYDQGILDGAYSVCYGESIIDHPELECHVFDFVLDFMRSTRGIDRSDPMMLRSPASLHPLVWIVKHHRRYARLCCTPPVIVASEAEVNTAAQRILAERVAEKIRRLTGLTLPKILLLWDAFFPFGVAQFLPTPVQEDWEESIDATFLVQHSGKVTELWSRIINW